MHVRYSFSFLNENEFLRLYAHLLFFTHIFTPHEKRPSMTGAAASSECGFSTHKIVQMTRGW
jgi:hypothetical protein